MRLRFANLGVSISTETNTSMSISHETDGDLTYKIGNGAGTSTPKVTPGLDTTHTVGVVFNTANVGGSNLVYNLGDGNVSLAPQEYSLYVNGALVAANLPATLGFSTGYNPALGIGRLGWLGNSDAATGIDLLVDNMVLYTGSDISVPEPSFYAALLGLFTLAVVLVRRRR